MNELGGKTVLVTGSVSGVGLRSGVMHLASVANVLCSEAAANITDVASPVDGGWTAA